jgi:hypothetical protein
MEPTESVPRLMYAERLRQGLMIEFSDGQGAIYSSELLYSIRSQAESLPGPEPLEDAAA